MNEEGKLLKDYQPFVGDIQPTTPIKSAEQNQRPMKMDSPTAVLGFGTNRRNSSDMRSPRRESPRQLWPMLRSEGSSKFVTVTPGYVTERLVKGDLDVDAIKYHLPDGIFVKDGDGNNTTELEEYAIAEGQCVAIKVNVLPDGTVGFDSDPPAPPVVVGVYASDIKSRHHHPPIGEGSTADGEAGYYYYKLATLTSGRLVYDDRIPGHDIDHWIDLPTFESAGGETIWQKWDPLTGKYKTKGLVGVSPITITPNDDTIDVGFDGAENLHLQVVIVNLSIDFTAETFSFGSISTVDHYWENGIYVGTTLPTDPGYSPIFQRTTHIANTAANP